MTERAALDRPGLVRPATPVRPARAPAAARPAAQGLDQAVAAIARVGVLLGASTVVYAGSLAAVAGLQAADDAALAAARAPRAGAIDSAAAANDRLEAAVLRAGEAAEALGGSYATVADAVHAYEERLAELAALVGEVEGRAAALPTRIALPSVTVRGPAAPAPRTTTTTGASGG